LHLKHITFECDIYPNQDYRFISI